MSTLIGMVIIFEAFVGIVVIYGWLHEDRWIAWERRAAERIRDAAREVRRRLCERWLNRGDLDVVVRHGR